MAAVAGVDERWGALRDVAEYFLYLWGDCHRAMGWSPGDRSDRAEVRRALAEAREAQVEGYTQSGARVGLPKLNRAVRLLQGAAVGLGGGEGFPIDSMGNPYGSDRPFKWERRVVDDPHPMAFVFIQVERCLYSFAPGNPHGGKARATLEWAVAFHLYAEGRPGSSLRHPELEGKSQVWAVRKVRERILTRLVGQLDSGGLEEGWLQWASNLATHELRRRRHGRRS